MKYIATTHEDNSVTVKAENKFKYKRADGSDFLKEGKGEFAIRKFLFKNFEEVHKPITLLNPVPGRTSYDSEELSEPFWQGKYYTVGWESISQEKVIKQLGFPTRQAITFIGKVEAVKETHNFTIDVEFWGDAGWLAQTKKYKGCVTQGETVIEALSAIVNLIKANIRVGKAEEATKDVYGPGNNNYGRDIKLADIDKGFSLKASMKFERLLNNSGYKPSESDEGGEVLGYIKYDHEKGIETFTPVDQKDTNVQQLSDLEKELQTTKAALDYNVKLNIQFMKALVEISQKKVKVSISAAYFGYDDCINIAKKALITEAFNKTTSTTT